MMMATSYTLDDEVGSLSCEFLRSELHRLEISLVSQLRHEIQFLSNRDRLFPITSNDGRASPVFLGSHEAPPVPFQMGKPLLPGSTQDDIVEEDADGLPPPPTLQTGRQDSHSKQDNSVEDVVQDDNSSDSLCPRELNYQKSGSKGRDLRSMGSSYSQSASTRAYMQRGRSLIMDQRKSELGTALDGDATTWTIWRLYFKSKMKQLAMVGESIVVVAIIMNALFYGVQTDIMAQDGTEVVPQWCVVLEMVFCCVFSVELFARITTHGCRFFVMEGRLWNWFDTTLVSVSWVDVFLETYANSQIASRTNNLVKNMGFMRWLRMLRIMRVLRVARLLKFMGDLNVVFSAIGKSMKSLVSTIIILFGLIYIFAVSFTQVSTSRRTELEGNDEENLDLQRWWGSVGRSTLSLFEAVFGGVDWDDVIVPLMNINLILGVVFTAYIGFMALAIMNVVTGCIVDAAIQNGKKVKDKAFKQHVRQFFSACDLDDSGHITREEMTACLTSNSVAGYMSDLGIEVQDVDILFHYLDDDGSNSIDPEELLVGLVRLRAGTRFIDFMTMLHELDTMKKTLQEEMDRLQMANKAIFDEVKSYSRKTLSELRTLARPSQVERVPSPFAVPPILLPGDWPPIS